MAVDSSKIMVGAATVSIGAYVAAGAPGSLTDVGHTKSPVTLMPSFEDFEVTSERAPGVMDKYPQMSRYKLKVPILEAIVANFTAALREPTGNQSGTPPNLTLLVGGATGKKYHQVQLVGPGVGTTGVRTITAWKAVVESVSEIPFAKGAEQLLEVVFDLLWDDSVTTNDKILKLVDA